MAEDVTFSGNRDVGRSLNQHDQDILELRLQSKDNKDADRALETRVLMLEFRSKVIIWIGGAVCTVSGIVFTWLLNKL